MGTCRIENWPSAPTRFGRPTSARRKSRKCPAILWTRKITSICADFLVELRGLCAGRPARSNRCKSDAMKE